MIIGTGSVENSVSGAYPQYSSRMSFDYFSGILSMGTGYNNDNTLDFGRRLKEIHITNASDKPVQYRFEEYFGSNIDGGQVEAGKEKVILNCDRKGIQLRSDGGGTGNVYVEGF